MTYCNRARRKALAALSVGALVCACPALAQDPRLSQAQSAGMAWLALADADDAAATYATASKRFRDTMPLAQWGPGFAQVRGQFGKIVRRTIVSTQPSNGPPEAPGQFVVMIFRSEFEKRPQGVETLTIEHEPDGAWRVAGYLMR